MIVKFLERDLERTCSDFLMLDGWRCLKTDPVSRREWGKGFGEKGMADYLYIRYLFRTEVIYRADVMWIEWKSPRGRLSVHQRAWHYSERARGGMTLIAGEDFLADFDSFVAWYRNSGLLMRRGL